jgi:hypothetical protein
MNVDVGPGEAIAVLPIEMFEHIAMTYRTLAVDVEDPKDKAKWVNVGDLVEEWVNWSLSEKFAALATDED